MNKKPQNWIQGMKIETDLFRMKIHQSNMIKKRKMVGEKLLQLRSRIEDWASLNGYENMGNWSERKNADGEVVWKKSHWEWVDDQYGIIINGYEFTWGKDHYRELNKLWKQYEIDVTVVRPDNPNFVADWEQLQQMEWVDE
tara:strand:- start:1215 stop:1637 length:423 start_codon:yes stop_codon:yes gene_type:complete